MNTKAAAAPSPGLALLIAATYAFPKSLGDRARSAAMNSILDIAVANRVRFDVNDGSAIRDAGLDMRTCVGVFRPLDQHWYEKAAIAGGTFARMWEKHFGHKPFVAVEAWCGDNAQPLQKQRVAPGLAILLPDSEPGDGLQTFDGSAVWWCTSLDFSKDRVTLCRYRTTPAHHMRRPSHMTDGAARVPVRRMTILRSEWDHFAKTIVVHRNIAAA